MDAQIWLFLTFGGGLLLWMLNKANDRSQGVDMKVARWPDYFTVYWIPLLSRFIIDSVLYGILFNQQLVTKGFGYLGWTNWAFAVSVVTQFKLVAFMFGFFFDALLDKFLTSSWSDKIPLINLIPSIPPPQKTGDGK